MGVAELAFPECAGITRHMKLPLVACYLVALQLGAAGPVEIGKRLEPLVDDFLIASLAGDARLDLKRPEPREVVLVTDRPWEGNTCAYYTIFQDGDRYRMYYRGSHYDTKTRRATHPEVTCYAESRDGIRWEKPELGLCEFAGSKANNIVWDGVGTHNFTVFKDTNPNCAPDARYKAIARGRSLRKGDKQHKHGLYVFQSADGLRWKLMCEEPVITTGAFDSQNLAFYDPQRGLYVDYHRWFHQGLRAIMTCTSKDFVNWTEPVGLVMAEKKPEHLYTNAIQPYERAPHIYLGFPTRYLPKEGQRVEPVFMSSRDGLNFRRWSAPVIPESAPQNRDGNRSNYMTWGLVKLPGNGREYSVYATEAYYTGPDSRLRRFTYRVDGFVSLRAGTAGGTMTTRPLVFAGNRLRLNHQVAANGELRVEILTEDGGRVLASSRSVHGDAIEGDVVWEEARGPSGWAGRPVRLRFHLRAADLYSLRFTD